MNKEEKKIYQEAFEKGFQAGLAKQEKKIQNQLWWIIGLYVVDKIIMLIYFLLFR